MHQKRTCRNSGNQVDGGFVNGKSLMYVPIQPRFFPVPQIFLTCFPWHTAALPAKRPTSSFVTGMAYRRKSTAAQGRDASAAMLRSRRRSQWSDTTRARKITPTFMLWCVSCVLLILSAAMHFSNKSKRAVVPVLKHDQAHKRAVVPVLKHDQAQCAEECWVRDIPT